MKWVREGIEQLPSFSPFTDLVDEIESCVQTNPTKCVESCKSLIEGISKTILTNKNIEVPDNITLVQLVQKTIDSIITADDTYRNDIVDLGRRIASVSHKLGEIRNNAGFISHGMDVLNPRLTETLSLFSCKVTETIGGFILNCYRNNRTSSIDHRLHYSDCKSFNEYFDELNPVQLGTVLLSASAALFEQDYEAYKDEYFLFLNRLENEIEDMERINE